MSESAEIILAALRSFNCAVPADAATFDAFGPEATVAVTAHCLNLMDPDATPPLKAHLPKNLASRHRVCAALGKRLKDSGYPGECGYNQFLYPNWRDVKQIFTFLVGRVPRDDDGDGQAGGLSAGGAVLSHTIQETLSQWRKQTWVPPFCATGRGLGHRLHTDAVELCAPGSGAAHARVPPVNRQVRRAATDVGPSLLEDNARRVARQRQRESLDNTEEARRAKARLLADTFRRAFAGEDPAALARAAGRAGDSGSRSSGLSMNDLLAEMAAGGEGDGDETAFSHQTEFAQDKLAATAEAAAIAAEAEADKEEEAKQERLRREAELEALQEELRRILSATSEAAKGTDRSAAKTRQLEAELAAQLARKKTLEAEYKIKAATLKMLPNAEANIEKLQGICEGSNARLLELATQWESHRQPLVSALRDIKMGLQRRKGECKWKVGEIRRMRDEMRTMAQQIRDAEERHALLSKELAKMPKNINRAVYTYRILDIIKQVRKQRVEIARIIGDIRGVQKETNSVAETLRRTELVTDDHVYKAASASKTKGGDTTAYVQTYRYLTEIRQKFDDMVTTAEEMGRLEGNTRDLQSRAKQLAARNVALNFERIKSDLSTVRAENKQLSKKLKSRG